MKPAPNILIVDDNPADVTLVREALAGSKHRSQLTSVGDGVEAMAFLNRRGKYLNAILPDLVLLDLNLPKRDGLAVLAAMKAAPDLRRIPAVIFSTSQLRKDVVRSYEMGANCYVNKPGNLTEFFSAVKSIEEFWFGFVNLPHKENNGSPNHEHIAD
jgi:CheY-like chemotaxis protein